MYRIIPQPSFSLGPVTIYWYGICIITAIVIGYLIALRRAKIYGIATYHLENLFILTTLAGLAGARLYHVILEWGYYSRDPAEIINLRAGGLAIHGAILGALIVLILYARKTKIPLLPICDLTAPSLALGQAIGSWGNFFTQELYGKPTDLPWKIYIEPAHRLPEYYYVNYYHPTFLYESLLSLSAALLLFIISRKLQNKSPGLIFGLYCICYGFIRFTMEMIRIDDVAVLGPFKFAQLASLVLIITGSILIWKARARYQSQQN
ncbi:MAG TPA: prolipoprotein diacylglyceryl transferase [bacterium]|nr:prolipoprotein diacylglyceryl transferase [bacterium]